MMDFNGSVVGVEHIPELVWQSRLNIDKAFSTDRIKSLGREQEFSNMIKIVCGDGRLGYKANTPYDVIHVGAAATEIPNELVEQLNFNGRMMIPVGDSWMQYIFIVNKDFQGTVTYKKHI